MSLIEATPNIFEQATTLSNEALTSIAEIDVEEFKAMGVQIANVGNALDQFVVSARYKRDGSWVKLYQEAADYTSLEIEGIIRQITADVTDDDNAGDVTALATAKTAAIMFDRLEGVTAIKLEAARAAGANTTLTVSGARTPL